MKLVGRITSIRFLLVSFLVLGLIPGLSSTQAAENYTPGVAKDFTDIKSKTTVYPTWFKDTFWDLNDDIAEARKAGKKGILIFTSTKTCSYCIAFIERSFSNPKLQARLRKQFDVLGLEVIADTEIIDVDGKAYHVKDFVKKYKSYFTPSLIFFGENGKVLLNVAGYYPPEKFSLVLDYLEGNHYESVSWRQYFANVQEARQGGSIVRDKSLFPLAATSLDRRAGKADRPLVVMFEKPACDPCKEMHEQTLKGKLTRDLLSRFDAAQVNASDNKNAVVTPGGKKTTGETWAKELDLAWYPAFVFFDEAGQEVFRIDGYSRTNRLNGTMNLVLTKGYLEEQQLQRWNRRLFVRSLDKK